MQIPTLVRRFTLIFYGAILRSRNGSLAFDNDKRHVTAFRPISEAAESWSCDKYKLSPRGRRDDMPPADGSSTRGGSTSVRGRVRSPHTSGGGRWLSCRQPACLQPRPAAPWDRRTDGSRYRLMPPVRRGHNTNLMQVDKQRIVNSV